MVALTRLSVILAQQILDTAGSFKYLMTDTLGCFVPDRLTSQCISESLKYMHRWSFEIVTWFLIHTWFTLNPFPQSWDIYTATADILWLIFHTLINLFSWMKNTLRIYLQNYIIRVPSNIWYVTQNPITCMFLVSACSFPCPIH